MKKLAVSSHSRFCLRTVTTEQERDDKNKVGLFRHSLQNKFFQYFVIAIVCDHMETSLKAQFQLWPIMKVHFTLLWLNRLSPKWLCFHKECFNQIQVVFSRLNRDVKEILTHVILIVQCCDIKIGATKLSLCLMHPSYSSV